MISRHHLNRTYKQRLQDTSLRGALAILCPFILLFFCSACALEPSSVIAPYPEPDGIDLEIAKESEKLADDQHNLKKSLEKKAERIIRIEPVMPVYNPMDDHIVSFSMVDEDLQLVLMALAKSVEMNLIIDPQITNEKKLITLNFIQAPASTVLEEILGAFDIYYEIRRNVIHIKEFEEKIFDLNFLDTSITTTFDVGGDVLGLGEVNAEGLTGSFSLSGGSAEGGNIYDAVLDTANKIRSPKGKIALNRISGTLYLKDTPAVIRTMARLMDRLKRMMERQILIEARIIEIILDDGYTFGVDWKYLRDSLATSTVFNESISWDLGTGLVINDGPESGTTSFSAVVNALRSFGNARIVSNPSIRAKHAQPAMISVGTSYTYKKSITTSTETSGTTDTDTTEVETSTVFDGLILGVIPFIENNENITLLINPIKSDVDASSLELESIGRGSDSISLPQVNIKEISTTIGVHDNDVIILGGLIDKRTIKTEQRMPVLSEIPLIGQLVRKEYESQEFRELVIVLKVSLI